MASDLLDPGFLAARSWSHLGAEPSGLADLARVNARRDNRNAVFARAVVTANADRTARLELGYSDRVAGSIGYHDAVYLPLRRGRTSSCSPSPRTSAAGACRRGSPISPASCLAEIGRRLG